ncbi:uncharacterized protein LOC6726201 [Drosophila simulans]|uniref:GD17318 n=1 Tax=Drosophila simulans TaxID=7240 RepID=B4R650_DROSI|nr:uncharacterized protein LOC6726201 [Drosophila simulans]EDX18154.1 GD17318 [Drosophila simulans]KMZ10259.1 uncharacterized protein Dsimw501_GD17318 [Drosophila simulans]
MVSHNALMLNEKNQNAVAPINRQFARNRRTEIRRLQSNKRLNKKVSERHLDIAHCTQKKAPWRNWGYLILVLVLAAGIGMFLQFTGRLSTVNGFLESYNNQFHSIVHNQDNYCNPSRRLGDMVLHARHQVLNQDHALNQLELALDNTTNEAIALVGTSGVGKSHTARILRETFPWPENVKTLSWTDRSPLDRVKSMLSGLTFCGQKMILIDNMTPKDAHFVPIINEMISEGEKRANHTEHQQQKRLTVVVIFNVNGMQSREEVEMDMEILRNMPHTQLVTFATLEPTHLVDCIRREAAIAMVHLEDEHVEEIIKSIDASASGCKSIWAKVLLYGKPIIADSQETDQVLPTD